MPAFAAQPSDEHAYQHRRVEPVRLGPLVLARHRDAGRMNDVGLDAVSDQPSRQPEPVAAGLVNVIDALTCDPANLAKSLRLS